MSRHITFAPPTLLSVVAPVYNEEELVEQFVARACAAVADYTFELVLVNDGSSDRTPELLDRIAAADPRVRVIHLSRNFGHQAALTAGLEHAVGDVVAMIDADLQDPPELIPEMIERWQPGLRRRLRRAQAARGRDRLQARHRLLVLQAVRQARPGRPRAQLRRLPPARPPRARRAAGDDRALALPARHDRLGGLHPDRRPLRARRAPRRRDQVHAAQDAALLARRDRLLLAPAAAAGHLRRACFPRASPSSRSPS